MANTPADVAEDCARKLNVALSGSGGEVDDDVVLAAVDFARRSPAGWRECLRGWGAAGDDLAAIVRETLDRKASLEEHRR